MLYAISVFMVSGKQKTAIFYNFLISPYYVAYALVNVHDSCYIIPFHFLYQIDFMELEYEVFKRFKLIWIV